MNKINNISMDSYNSSNIHDYITKNNSLASDEDKLSMFSGFSYNRDLEDFEYDNTKERDVLEQNYCPKTYSDYFKNLNAKYKNSSGYEYDFDLESKNGYDSDFEKYDCEVEKKDDLDSELDFQFDFDIINNDENNMELDKYYKIKNKIINNIKLNKNDLVHIQYANNGIMFELIKLFNNNQKT